MKVRLVPELSVVKNAEELIGWAAAICYDGKTDPESNRKRAIKCRDDGHLTTMRFAYATFEISEISRVCSHQIVRIANAGQLQESQRYVPQSCIEYIDPPALAHCPVNVQLQWAEIQDAAEALYLQIIREKLMVKGDARYILPQGCSTAINFTGNFQMWQHFIKLRSDKAAQWEVRG